MTDVVVFAAMFFGAVVLLFITMRVQRNAQRRERGPGTRRRGRRR